MATTKKKSPPAAKKTAPAKKAAPAPKRKSASAGPRATVRMYRQGLGDCFLITFPRADGSPFHMLIDCGVVLGTSDAGTKIQTVVKNLQGATDKHIDLLVATHEHWDHISGFTNGQAQSLFDEIEIERVWLAWTEDPADALATKLRAERRSAENALRMAVTRLGVSGDDNAVARVGSVVEFFGAKAGSTGDALDYIKKRAGKPKYCKPGEPPITFDDVPGVRFWILGPPKDEKLIKKSNPSKGAAYGLDAGANGSQSFFIAGVTAGMAVTAADALPDAPPPGPFDAMYCIPLARAEHLPFFEAHYFGAVSDSSLSEKIDGHARDVRDQSWRRIDDAWLGMSETMALQLDSATNNTSLAIAIELTDTGEVLLFPGDAQAGNWMSWQDVKWDEDKDEKRKAESGPNLLARTTFYKVGHHGSHNATLKALGLELMTSSELTAMIPVDHDMAVKKRWGKMPLPELIDRIEEKTEGRVLRVDDKVTVAKDLAKLKPKDTADADWKRFTDRVTVDELYFEIEF